MRRKRNRHAKHIVSMLLSLALVLGMTPAAVFAAGNGDGSAGTSDGAEASYAPGEVIVMFRDGAVGETDTSLRSARSMKVTGADFGAASEATGEGAEAAEAVKAEAEILGDSLGGSFVIEDSLLFEAGESSGADAQPADGTLRAQSAESGKEGLRIALVSSDRYSTEEMIDMLSDNPDVAAAEPNAYLHLEGYDSYSLNDRFASYLYQDNAPAADNRGGDDVSPRGEDPEAAISANAASGWKKLPSRSKEVVVAVVDTGINLEHEDLVNRLWTNPGNIGLAGEHGYNIADNNTDIMDHEGHGSHCAGIIAAEANNGRGVAGVSGDADVKIMMLKTSSDKDETKLYTAMGSFNYVLKAKQRGVNVVATSNSWGRSDSQSDIFNEIVDRMGQAGILTFTAAGNSSQDLDRNTDNPASNESVYGITVGAAGISGKPAGFSNYGKTSVDVFASGVNVLSTVGYKCYMPNIYTRDERRSTTEYFGKFTTDSKVSKNTITPYTPDERVPVLNPKGMKSFGEFEFHKQAAEGGSGSYVPSKASCELSIVKGRYFTTGDKSASLKVTIRGACIGEEYYVFFPFTKNSKTTGRNTRFSIMYQSGTVSGGGSAEVFGGEVYKNDKGAYRLTGAGLYGHAIGTKNDGVDTHLINDPENAKEISKISDYVKGEKTGIGLRISPSGSGSWKEGETRDLVLYIDSIAVSKPDAEISLSDSYEMMSGTSMACPSAAGACALMASIYPKTDHQTDAEYAEYIRNKLFSCVRQTDELADLCSTGGYIDFRLLREAQPVIDDAVCDIEAGTLTLYGEELEPGMELTYKRLAQKDAKPVVLPEEGMTLSYGGDGKSVVIGNAESLFGSHLEFEIKDGSGAAGRRSFFTVKGQNKPEMLDQKHYPNPTEEDYMVNEPSYKLFTDASGDQLYGFDRMQGIVYRFNGRKFVALNKGSMKEALTGILAQKYDDYELTNNITISIDSVEKVLTDGDELYGFCSYTHRDTTGTGEETVHRFVARMDVSAEEPEWTFEKDEADLAQKIRKEPVFHDGRLYFLGDDNVFSSYDPASGTFREEEAVPDDIRGACFIEHKGELYMMFGADWNYVGEDLKDSLSDRVFRYDADARTWQLVSEGVLKYIGKFDSGYGNAEYQTAVASTDKGIAVVNMSVDGAGNVSMFDPENGTLTPLYYTFNDGLSDQPLWGSVSCAASKDGVYYVRDDSDEIRRGYGLWLIPASAYDDGDSPVDPDPDKPVPVDPSDRPDPVDPSGQSDADRQRQEEAAADAAFIGIFDKSVPAVKGVRAVAAKKGFTVRWTKAGKKQQKKFTNVEIQYCPDKSFARNATAVKFAKKSKNSCKVKGLGSKKTCYVRVRNVKIVNGVKYAGKWSKTIRVKTK